MPTTAAETVQLLSPEGTLVADSGAEEYQPYIDELSDATLQDFHRNMVVTRAFDVEAANLQRQGQLGLWVPSLGQEAAQVGSAFASRPQDTIFPAYREHAIARHPRGRPDRDHQAVPRAHPRRLEPGGDQQLPPLHARHRLAGAARDRLRDGRAVRRRRRTGDPTKDEAVVVYFGDGAMSQGDVSEAFVFAASYQTPQVFFLQNNHWAISVPVERQSRTPLVHRSAGFGIPGVQVDGNDVLASYAVSRKALDEARAGDGPRFIEALTYRMGAHTSSDDPTRYRDPDEFSSWQTKDPIARFETYLRSLGEGDAFFESVAAEGADLASDVRRRTYELESPPTDTIFDYVYTDDHTVMAAQKQWLADYEAGYEA